jgi:serine/threonine protein kinase
MAAPATGDDLLDLLEKSRLLESYDLEGYLRRRPQPVPVPEPPDDLAAVLVRDGLLTRFQADNLLQGKWLRYFIGPYKVLDALGAGSSGVVYLCEDARLRRRVAVKVLQAVRARDRTALERFNREARAAAGLDHRNIVRAFDVGREDRFHYLVMEYVDGQSLRKLIKAGGPLSPAQAADYLRQAALGLGHAHAAGLIHRDIKPSNLMVDRRGVVKILDLGLARLVDDEGDELTRGAVLGNADFIAPEQALDSHAVDARADVYSLGATFWYCLTGHRPARAGLEFLRSPSRPRHDAELRADVPEGLWQVLRKMMAPAPADRYQTPAEVLEAVTPFIPDKAASALDAERIAASATTESLAVTAETVPDQPALPMASSPAPGPRRTAPIRRSTGPPLRWIPYAWLAACAILLCAAGVWLALRAPDPTDFPGREPGAAPYFKPVSPHSP